MSDITFEMSDNRMVVHHQKAEPWKVTMVDTGENTMTGGRLKRVADYVKDEEIFCLTYGDGVSNVNITELIAFHKAQQVKVTLTSVIPPGRFGVLDIQGDKVRSFQEKPQGDGTKINGGFFVLSPKVIEYMQDDQTILEKGPLERLAKEGSLAAYQHKGFWQPMDTLRDKMHLEELWQSGKAPWKVWQ
jgi:glucose-1-phosphate cytidylyltransferase